MKIVQFSNIQLSFTGITSSIITYLLKFVPAMETATQLIILIGQFAGAVLAILTLYVYLVRNFGFPEIIKLKKKEK